MKCGTIIILSPICPRDRNTKNRWGQLAKAFLTLVRHVSMRTVRGAGQLDTLEEAKALVEAWRKTYNRIRPHSSLGYRSPAPEAQVVGKFTLGLVPC